MKKQLKPCPFCGSDNLQSRDRLEWSDVRCKACLQSVSSFPCSAENIWNKRPIEDALQVELDQLRKDNQALVEQMNALAGKLEKAIEILADDGAIACPAIKVGYKCNNGNGCNRLDSCLTGECWTEYFEKGDKP